MKYLPVIVLALLASCDKEEDLTVYLPKPGTTGFVDVSADTWKGIAALTCKPTRVEACGREGCKEGKPVVEVRWEPSGTYQRCDTNGCDSYQPKVSYSGIWANIAIPESGMMARITADGQYMEVATINDTALVYHGQCKRVESR